MDRNEYKYDWNNNYNYHFGTHHVSGSYAWHVLKMRFKEIKSQLKMIEDKLNRAEEK